MNGVLRYVFTQGQTYGPADLEHLLTWIHQGRLRPDDWIWIDEENRWVLVREIPEFDVVLRQLEFRNAPMAVATPSSVPSSHLADATALPDSLYADPAGPRRFLRLDTHLQGQFCALQIDRVPESGEYKRCMITNVSAGGCAVELPALTPVGYTIWLIIELKDGREPFRIKGKILRTAPGLLSGMTEHGVKFLSLQDAARDRLRAYLEGLLEEQM